MVVKVALVGLIACLKMMEIIFANKKRTILKMLRRGMFFKKKNRSNCLNIEKNISKILKGSFHLKHPLIYISYLIEEMSIEWI